MQQQTLLSFRTGKLRFRPLSVFVPGERMKKGPRFFSKTKEYSGGNDCFQAKVLARECLFFYLVFYLYMGIGTSFRNSKEPVTATAKNNIRERFPRLARISRRKIKEIATGHNKTFAKRFFLVLQMTPQTRRHNNPQIITRFHHFKKKLLLKNIFVQAQCFPYTYCRYTAAAAGKRNSKQQKEQRPPKTFFLSSSMYRVSFFFLFLSFFLRAFFLLFPSSLS